MLLLFGRSPESADMDTDLRTLQLSIYHSGIHRTSTKDARAQSARFSIDGLVLYLFYVQ